MRILAIDPGREKCGLAVGEDGNVLKRAVVRADNIDQILGQWITAYEPRQILIGNRTGGRDLLGRLQVVAIGAAIGVPAVLVDEAGTTLEARRRYFQEHPPRGWRRLLPRSMQRPPEPYDDYVAVLLIERFSRERASQPKNPRKMSK